jgi:hypothetical protein
MEDRSSLLIDQGPQDEADTPARMESRSPGTLPVGKLDRSQTLRIFVRSSSTAGGPSGTTEAPRPGCLVGAVAAVIQKACVAALAWLRCVRPLSDNEGGVRDGAAPR